jgi:hypothetical protein
MIWIHVLALRVFVETVLRYGLPLDFVAGIVQVSSRVFDELSVWDFYIGHVLTRGT